MAKESKALKVLHYLQKHGSITSKEAIEKFWETRLSAVIFDLREEGYIIETEREAFVDNTGTPNHFARYIYKGKSDSKPSKLETAYAKRVEKEKADAKNKAEAEKKSGSKKAAGKDKPKKVAESKSAPTPRRKKNPAIVTEQAFKEVQNSLYGMKSKKPRSRK